MAFPTSPSNGDQTTINGVLYQYNSTKTAWVRVANPGLDDLRAALEYEALVEAIAVVLA